MPPREHDTLQAAPENKAAAFTLIELLVTIAIVAVLAAFLLPALSSAREKGLIAKNSGNLRGLGRGFALFAADHGGWLPPSRYPAGTAPGPMRYWPSQIMPYVNDRQAFIRPGANLEVIGSADDPSGISSPYLTPTDPAYNGLPTAWSYGINGTSRLFAFPENTTGRPLSSIPKPSETMALFDGWLWFGGSATINRGRIHAWKDGRACILWMDGRVTREFPKNLTDNDALVDKVEPN